MEFYYYSPSETFVVLTVDQFVGRGDGLLEQQRQGSHVSQKLALLILTVSTNAFHSNNSFCCFSRCQPPTNCVAPYFSI